MKIPRGRMSRASQALSEPSLLRHGLVEPNFSGQTRHVLLHEHVDALPLGLR